MDVSRGERRTLAALAMLALLPFIALAVWARFASPAPWEAAIVSAVAIGEGPFADVTRAINTLGNLPVWAVLVTVVAVATGFVRGAVVALVVALSFASDLAAFGVKLIVERDRPESAAVEHLFGLDSFSFPSGHVVRAVALVSIVAFVFVPRRWRLPAALVGAIVAGAVMGYARVSLGVHWPTDALAAVLLGVAWFGLTAWLIR